MSTTGSAVPPTRPEQVTMLQTMISGLQKHESQVPTLTVQGKSYPVSALISALQARLATVNAVAPARAVWQHAVQTEKTDRVNTKGFVSGTRQALLIAFSGQVDVLADLGLSSRKPRVISPETKVVAAQKAKATRAARHTMGKKQKAAIQGDVTTVLMTPVTSTPNGGTTAPAGSAASPAAATAPGASQAPSGASPTSSASAVSKS